jgi:predicted dehydrogenase
MCGDPADIVAQGRMFDEQKEGHLVASIRFKSGALGQLTASFGTGGSSEQFTAYGNGYTVFVEPTSRPRVRIMRGGKEVESYGPLDTMDIQLRHFIDCVKEDREPLTSARHAVRIMRFTWALMDAAGFGIPAVPNDGRGWVLWCTCGDRVIPKLESCPKCGQEWGGHSLPVEDVRRT